MQADGEIRFVARGVERLHAAPVEIVSAAAPAEVPSCLARVEAGVARGLFAAGFLAYEAAPAFDAAFKTHAPGDLPVAWFGLYDRQEERAPDDTPGGEFEVGDWAPLVSARQYRAGVRRIRELIAAGDTYQVNYTFPLRTAFRGDALSWFRRLCAAQQADYCAYIRLGRFRILSASPELFFRLENETLITRPMKGTRPRGRWPDEDRRFAEELAASAKERAENVMIVDLLRNDMTRISAPRSVRAQSLYDVERYPTVWQMTSTIRSRTRAQLGQIMGALFPSGSVTGAPKIRTMEIIRELEPHPRGIYCGCIGWWAPDRRAEFNVAIRTAVVDAETGLVTYNVGSGITFGSSPAGEYDECLVKAAVLNRRAEDFELLESIRFDGEYFLLREHLERLAASAAYFGFACDRAGIERALAERAGSLAARLPENPAGAPLKVRLLLRRDGSFTIAAEPASAAKTVRLGLAGAPIDDRDVFLFHKTTRRDAYRQALASRPGCDDVLLWNRRGEITESTIANVVLDLGGKLLTPPIASGLLAGTFRRQLLERGEIREKILKVKDLTKARRIMLINSVRKWMDVHYIGAAG